MTSKITTEIAVDPALPASDANEFTVAQRRYIDDQIRGCQFHLVDSLLSGMVCTWVDLDASSEAAAAGDLGCSAADASSPRKMKRVGTGTIGAAKGVHCVFLSACAPGGRTRAAIAGRVPRSITGLPAAAGYVVATVATGRAGLVSSLSIDDYPIGFADNAGTLTLAIPSHQVVAGGLGADAIDLSGKDQNWSIFWSVSGQKWITARGVRVIADGQFNANEATPVPVSCSSFAAGDFVVFQLKTLVGSGEYPAMASVTPGAGFSPVLLAGNTSTYYWAVLRLGAGPVG